MNLVNQMAGSALSGIAKEIVALLATHGVTFEQSQVILELVREELGRCKIAPYRKP